MKTTMKMLTASLSLAYGIVQKHKGRIEVDTELGRGTCFRVLLPVRHTEELS